MGGPSPAKHGVSVRQMSVRLATRPTSPGGVSGEGLKKGPRRVPRRRTPARVWIGRSGHPSCHLCARAGAPMRRDGGCARARRPLHEGRPAPGWCAPPSQARDATGWEMITNSASTCAAMAPSGRPSNKRCLWKGRASNLLAFCAFRRTPEILPRTYSGELASLHVPCVSGWSWKWGLFDIW
jgi:hypothetical protein